MRSGDVIREARKRAGLTQSELASRAATTQSAIARAESGKRKSSLDEVQRLLRLCGFALSIQVVPYDDSDLVQSERLSRLTAEERLHDLTDAVRSLTTLKARADVAH